METALRSFCRAAALPALLLFAALAARPAEAACTTSWTNPAGGDWSVGTNWNNGVPDAADNACIRLNGTYTVTRTGAITVNSLELGRASGGAQTLVVSGGAMSFPAGGTIFATGRLEWQDNYLTAGTLTNGGLIVLTTAAGERGVRGDGTPGSAVLRNTGTVRWEDGVMYLWDAGRWENAGLVNVQGNGDQLVLFGSGPHVFANEAGATLRKSVDGGTFAISAGIEFQNAGTVDADDGTIHLRATCTYTATSVLTASGGGRVEMDAGTHAHAGGSLFTPAVGATVAMSGGTHTFAGTHASSPTGDVVFGGGAVMQAGANAVFDFGGTGFQWQGNYVTAGTLTNEGLIVLNGGTSDRGVRGDGTAGSAVLRNEGTVRWEDGVFYLWDAGRWENAALVDVQGNGDQLVPFGSGPHVFANEAGATFRKSTNGGDFSVHLDFENEGTVDAQTGLLSLRGTHTHADGSLLTAAAGAQLAMDAGAHTYADGAVLAPSAGGTVLLSGGTHLFEGTVSGTPAGDVIFGVGATMQGGVAGVLDFGGTGFQWQSNYVTAGTLTNEGLIVLNSGASDRGVRGDGTAGSAVLRNEGTMRWENGVMYLWDAGRWENAGLVDVRGGGDALLPFGSGPNVFASEAGGTLRKSTSSGTFTVASGLDVENAGTIDVASGTLILNATTTHTGRVQGTGTVQLNGVFTNNGTFAPGTSTGILTVNSNYENATLEIELGGTTAGTNYDRLDVNGSGLLGGTLVLELVEGYEPTVGDTYVVLTANPVQTIFDTIETPPGLEVDVDYTFSTVIVTVTAVGPDPTYTVTQPEAGARWAYGSRQSIKWSGPGVPNGAEFVLISIRKGNGAPVQIARVKNKGSYKYDVPATFTPGTDYQVIVTNELDPAQFGRSARFTIYDPAQSFAFTSPAPGETWARGTTRQVTWTTPAGSSGDVVLTLIRGVTQIFSVTIPNTGSYSYAIPSNQTPGTYYFTIEDDDDALYFGESGRFAIGRFQVTDPVASDVWTEGATETVAWAGPGLSGSGTIKVILKRKGFANTTLANNVPYSAGSVSVTVPNRVSATDYYITLVYTNGAQSFTVNSLTFELTNPAPLVAEVPTTSHFAAPVGVEDWTELAVSVPGLADGAEVAAFTGEVLLAAGHVEAGQAQLWAASTFVDAEADQAAVAPNAALTLRAYTGSTEVTLDATSVVSEATGEAAALALTEGDVLLVAAVAGVEAEATTGVPTEFALDAAYPNPFNPSTTLAFALPQATQVHLAVYDGLGRQVALLVDGRQEAGTHTVRFDALGLASGVYVVRMEAGSFSAARRVTLIK